MNLLSNPLPSVDESFECVNQDECSFCGTPHPAHKPVDFGNQGLTFCNQLCEDGFNYLEYLNNKYSKTIQ